MGRRAVQPTSHSEDTGVWQRPAALQPIALRILPDRPLVSVLVSNYNYASYLAETIESVLRQTYPHWELIVCDDGSTDNSVEIVERFAQAEIRIHLIRKTNDGHASGLNAAFREARGEIICLLDSDDLFTPDKLERVVACCLDSPDCGFVAHRVVRVTQARQKQGVWPRSGPLPSGWYGPSLLKGGGIVPFMPPTSGLSLRRELALRLFPLPTKSPLNMCPDQVIMRLGPLVTPIASTAEVLAEQRLHQSNTYGSARMTAASVSREIALARALWQQQKDFLAAIDAGLSEAFEPIEDAQFLLFLLYVRAKLSHDTAVRACFERFIASLRQDRARRKYWLWRLSIHFPVSLFDRIVNLLFGQSNLKQLLWRLSRFASARQRSAS
jgi:glycosyltransferase involved in cell wall biosynthesis